MTSILEHSFNFNGFNCYVILRHIGKSAYRCGYMQVSKRLPINTAKIDCHGGGITYAHKESVSDELRQIVGQILSEESED